MPRFLPFPGIRYRTRDITEVSAPPYDVIEPEARAALTARDPHNSVRLILPDAYAAAAAAFAQWRAEGVLVTDDVPTFSIYRMDFTGDDGIPRHTTGVLGELALDDDGGGVMPHERTLPKAKTDRLELLRATRANLDPIWGLSLAGGLSTQLHPGDAEPDAVATDEDGFHHSLWRIDDPEPIAAISRAVGSALVVLADGHHRFETADNYRRERRAAGIDDPGAGAIMTLIVELAADQLCVRAIHRLLTGVKGRDLRTALDGPFFVHAAGPNEPDAVAALEVAMHDGGGLGLVDRDGLALLLPTAELEARVAALPPELRDVDSARFDAGVRPAVPDATLAYRNDARTVAAQVAKGDADAALLLRPVSVATIRAAAEADLRMPEKTTFFAPKPRTGMVFRALSPLLASARSVPADEHERSPHSSGRADPDPRLG